MRWGHAALICVTIAALAGCGSEQDPVAQLRAEVREDPTSVELRLQLGEAYLEEESYHDAFIQYSNALELDENSFEALLGLATVEERLNNLEGAIGHVNSALEMAPDSADALALKGKLMLRTDEPEKAADALAEAVALDPDNDAANRFLPVAYIRSDQRAEAEQAARAAVERMPDDVDVRINLATALMARGKSEESEATLREAMELDPADPAPPLRLAEILVHEGRGYDEVMQLTQRSLELDPGQGEADAVAALALRKQGRAEEAVRRLHAAATTHPRNVRLWLMLAAVYRDMGEDEAAARAAAMAFRFAPRRRIRPAAEGETATGPPPLPPVSEPDSGGD